MADTDTQLEFKKRARRRLVGAAAIALFAAIILPMIMDREPHQAGQDIQIRIPSQEGANFVSRAIQGNDPAPAQPRLPEQGASTPVAVRTLPATAVSTPLSERLTPPPPRNSASEPRLASEASHPKADKKPEGEKKPSPEKKPAPEKKLEPATAEDEETSKPAHHASDEGARAAAILSGGAPADHKPAAAAEGKGFVVQLGAFKDAANVASIRSRVKAEGYASYAEHLGDKTRVRAGPFATREEAEKAAAKLSHAGLSAIVAAR